MENKSRKQKSTRKKTRIDSTTKKEQRPVNSAKDNTNRIRRKKRTNNQNDRSGEAYSNYTRLLQLFPYLHPAAIDRIFANCNRDFIRTIDNLLYIKRHLYFTQTNDRYPHTATTTDPHNGFVHNMNETENKQNHTNTNCTKTIDMHQANSNYNNDDDDGYIPNGSIEGIREQIRMHEEQCSLTESVLSCSLDSEMDIVPLSQWASSVDSNIHTSTPQVKLDSVSAGDDVNVQDETCSLQ